MANRSGAVVTRIGSVALMMWVLSATAIVAVAPCLPMLSANKKAARLGGCF